MVPRDRQQCGSKFGVGIRPAKFLQPILRQLFQKFERGSLREWVDIDTFLPYMPDVRVVRAGSQGL
jgi:hypothetical protein